MKKYDDYFLTQTALNSKIEFISGKYFYEHNEIKNIDKYISKIYFNITKKMINERDLNYFKSVLINNPTLDEELEWWYRPSIIDEALEQKEKGYFPKQLPFPLEDKQLIILNILLFHPEQEVFFITTGIGGSGKSTFLNIIKQLFDNDVSSTPLGDLGQPFVLAEALKHRLIASDELGTGEVNLPIIETIVSKQNITVNEKYGSTYTTLAQSALFFCCNQAPKIDISDTGMLRRIVYYQRNTRIKNPDPTLNKKKWSRQDLIDFIIVASEVEEYAGFNASLDVNSWKEPFLKETNTYLINSNSVGLYVKYCKKNGIVVYDYSIYKDWSHSNGYKPFSRQRYEEILEWVRLNYCDEEMLKKEKPFEFPIAIV